ncbi:hypothetical protein [Blastococcus brunescens]|uniref:AMP-dependent synthetase/ligase domain-containing protein n=1 Tax=Blastococcus brunescens TaxID=1564165 RepID=A0ABZ1AX82_9ACTN|nr:hypothetical protein [Blastococcus sp. BMG 8361]WRL63174.1 hypothetical protein U6N30_25815 [Blastococcus sp. BMG 8361]
MEEAGTSLAELVRAAARRRPEAPAVVAAEQRLTWAELDATVDRAAAGFAGRGLAPATGWRSSCPTGSPGCAPPSARCAPDWSSCR